MPAGLSDSFESLDVGTDAALDLALVLSSLEAAQDEPNAQDVADEMQSLAAIYDNPEPSLSLYRPPRTSRSASPPPQWTPSSADPLRLVLSTTLAPPHDSVPLHLLLSLPKGYPATEPPLIQLQDRYLGASAVSDDLFGEVLRVYMHDAEAGVTGSAVEWTGGVCLFEGIELVREMCSKWVGEHEDELRRNEAARKAAGEEQARAKAEVAEEAEEGRRRDEAVFVGHVAKVTSLDEVDAVMDALLSNNKIARATHNISAYQFTTASGTRHADNDDDGETAAGSRLAHLLTLLDVPNVMVVVTRWYGGIHLGPDRFKLSCT
ncbi:hypothetical protein Rhopal_000819-T1 [Rhodotorula paludigena]|uniref:RWD domain-containing protein n=1 Tax=Rhodotorula paludigena TaxID=86838 RepID=A0AAV5GBP3_9BASI|nr:hypothetical protein Rhopal_000819-T1 [Rhodotorula paludigena]